MRLWFLTIASLTVSVIQAEALEFESYEGVTSTVTRLHLIEGSTTVLVEYTTPWEVAGGAITYGAYAFDCAYGAYSLFHDSYDPVAEWPVPIPDAGWFKAESGWRQSLGKLVCAESGLAWLGT